MNHPDRQRLEQLLHAYELGVLSAAEEEEFELALLQDPELFERVRELEEATHLLRNDTDVRKLLSEVLHDRTDDERVLADRPSLWWRIRPVYVAVAIAILLSILVEWQVECHPSLEVTAAQNRIAVMKFQDLTGQEKAFQWGAIATSLMVVDLSESHYLQVVSEQRIDNILATATQAEDQQQEHQIATMVARASNARWLLSGDILQTQPAFAISTQLTDMESGNMVASELVRGQDGEDIFAIVDRLAKAVRQDLALPESAQQEPHRSVAEVTTHSPEAYRLYLAGRDYYRKFYYSEAWDRLQQAVNIDSTFAIAYYYLFRLGNSEMLKEAVRYAHHASQRDQVYIRVAEAAVAGNLSLAIAQLEQAIRRFPDYEEFYLSLGAYHHSLRNFEQAIQYFQRAIDMNPLFADAYNGLAYAYLRSGQEELARNTIDKLIALAPDEANSWDSRGELYTVLGGFDDAEAAFKQALAIKPDFFHSAISLALLNLRKGDYGQARQWIASQINSPNNLARSQAKTMEALIEQTQGRFREALNLLELGIIGDSLEYADFGFSLDVRQKLLATARIYTLLGDHQAAIRTAIRTGRPGSGGRQYSLSMGQILAVNGDTVMARDWIRRWTDAAHVPQKSSDMARHVDGAVAFFAGDWESAIADLSATVDTSFDVYAVYLLGQACLQAEKPSTAIAWLEKGLQYRGTELQADWLFYRPLIHFLLASSYERTGDLVRARENYAKFLEYWQNANDGLKEVELARARLAQLSTSP